MLEPTNCACNNENSISPPEDLSKSSKDLAKKGPFFCVYDSCYKSYNRLSHLRRHEDTHENTFRCTEENCSEIFKTKFTLKKHVDNVHLKKNPKKYKCSDCGQDFNKHSWLTRHQYRHTGVKPYLCPKEGCDKRFLVPSKLKRHLKVHEGYTCSKDNCDKKFPTWTLYVKHAQTAHPTIHRCHYCEKIFASSSNLKAHLDVHKFDREVHLCPKPNCSRFYFMKRNLTHHLKTYHEKRPFICSEQHCYKAFKSEGDLNAHASRHDPKKRNRKKKSNSKPSFAAQLAGCVPKKKLPSKKTIELKESENKSPAIKIENASPGGTEQKIEHAQHVCPSEKRSQSELINCPSTIYDVSMNDKDNEIDIVLNMNENLMESRSFNLHNIVKSVSA